MKLALVSPDRLEKTPGPQPRFPGPASRSSPRPRPLADGRRAPLVRTWSEEGSMPQLSSRWLAPALVGAALLCAPAQGHAQALDTVKAAAGKVLPVATQVVQQKVGGGSGAPPSGTAGQVVNVVK